MKTIGIDLGTTTISLAVYDSDTKQVFETRTLPHSSFIQSSENWEKIQNTELIMTSAQHALDELLKRHSGIDAIGLSGQMHGILYLDAQGKASSPLITWQDQRGNLPEFDGFSMTEHIEHLCQLKVPTGYGLNTHLYNIKKNKVPKKAVSFCTIADYLGMILTNRKTPLLHSSMAASLGFYDCLSNCFLKDEIEKSGIKASMLPKITSEIQFLGTYRGIPVSLALGDCQASYLGSAGIKSQTILLNIGTGSQISILSKQIIQTSKIETRPFLNGQYLLCGSSLCGGRAYATLERFFRTYAVTLGYPDQKQYKWMAKLAEKADFSNKGLTVQTTLNGTRSNPNEKGSILNLSEDNFTPENLIMGVLQGMIQELYELYEEIQQETPIQPKHIFASGNGFRKNPLLQKIAESKFKSSIELAAYQEEAAVGAAISATLAKK